MAQSDKSRELYHRMEQMGYPVEFCKQIAAYMNTDWTATRMLGYLRYGEHISPEEIVDEMLAILEDRHRIMEKKELEYVNEKWNRMMQEGFDS